MSANVTTFDDERPPRTRHLFGGLIIGPEILNRAAEGVQVLHVADDRVFRDVAPWSSASHPQARRYADRRAA
jgi:hypothetical protein